MDGHGTRITFGTSGFTASLISVDGPDIKRESLDDTYMDTTEAMEFEPAALYDGGELSLTIKHKVDALPPVDGAREVIAITWPGAKVWTFDGFFTGYKGGAAIGQRMEATCNIKVSGEVVVSG